MVMKTLESVLVAGVLGAALVPGVVEGASLVSFGSAITQSNILYYVTIGFITGALIQSILRLTKIS